MADRVVLLLVEDDDLVCEFAKAALEEGGYAVVMARSGRAAVENLNDKANEIAGLVTDIQLGGGPDGWEVARQARVLNPTIPVVYMSGDSAGDWTAQGVPRSVILQKPFVAAQLVTAISTLLNEVDSLPSSDM